MKKTWKSRQVFRQFFFFVLLFGISFTWTPAQISKAEAELQGYTLLEKGRRLSRQWHYIEALPYYRAVAAKYPNTDAASEAHWYLGTYLEKAQKRYLSAIKEYDKAIRTASPTCEFGDYARLDRARALYQLGRYPEAIKACEAILDHSEHDEVTGPAASYLALAQAKLNSLRKGNVSSAVFKRDPLCGPRSLLLLARASGIQTDLNRLKKLTACDSQGTTLANLMKGAKATGLELKAAKLTLSDLKRVPLPCIVWVLENHFTVVEAVQDNEIILREPDGRKQRIHLSDFSTLWGGESLIAEKGKAARLSSQLPTVPVFEWSKIRGGSHLGTPGTPGSGSGPYGPNDNPPGDDPINMVNGNQSVQPTPDLVWTNCVGPHVIFQRAFNAQLTYPGNFGDGWTNTLDIHLTVDAGQNATVMRADGRMDRYTWTGSGYLPPTGIYDTLTRNGNNTYTMRMKLSRMRYHFNTFGRLTRVEDHNGNALTFTYQQIGQPGDPGFKLLLISVTDANGRVTTLTYNADNRCSSITDPAGRSVQFIYTGARLTSVTLPDGSVIGYTYGTNIITRITTPIGTWNMVAGSRTQLLGSITDPNNRTTSYYYQANQNYGRVTDALNRQTFLYFDASGRCTAIIDPLGNTMRYAYNASGNLLRLTDANSNTRFFSYDSRGNLMATTDPLGRTWQFQFNSEDQPTQIRDPLGRITTLSYDARGNLTSVVTPSGSTSQYTYNANGLLATSRDPNGGLSRYTYNTFGSLTQVEDPTGAITRYTYDNHGNIASIINPNGSVTQYETDALDRITRVTWPDGSSAQYAYRSNTTWVSSITDEKGRLTQFFYDNVGNLTRVVDPLGRETRYTYDAIYNLTQLTDAKGQITRYVYNNANRLIEANYAYNTPAQLNEQFGYDGVGNIVSKTDGTGARINYKYDAANRILSITTPDYWVNFAYDALGNTTLVEDPTGKSILAYNVENQLTSYTAPTGERVRYTYDAAGNTLSVMAPSGTTRYRYDLLGHPTRVNSPLGIFTYRYDPAGNMIEQRAPNHRSLFSYDSRDRMTAVRNFALNGTLLSSLEYLHDALGNPLRVTTFEGVDYSRTIYVYDALDRLVTETRTGGTTPYSYQYTYDQVGNRLSRTSLLNGQTINYTYDAANRLLTAGATTYTYDVNGQLRTRTDSSGTVQFGWDTRNQLRSVQRPDGSLIRYEYDGFGNRVRRIAPGTSTTFLFDVGAPMPSMLSSTQGGNTNSYSMLPGGAAIAGQEGAYLFDHIGTVTGTAGAGGTTNGFYDSWGNGTGAGGLQPRGYIGRQGYWTDTQTGLMLLGRRWYDPAVGRFISRDPIRYAGGDINLYAYGANNPLRFMDPWGLDAWDWIHGGLDAFGLIPGLGEIADGINAGLYALRGKWGYAAISLAAMVPVVGDLAKGGKYAYKAGNAARKAIVVGENMSRVKAATRALRDQGVNARWYQAWKINPWDPALAMRRNEAWIKRKMREGYDIYDIGIDAARPNRSPFYDMERRMLNQNNYPTTPFNWP
jgi:RHS repeat-associated protein